MFKMVAFAGVFALTAMFAGSAKAKDDVKDNDKVMLKHPDWRQSNVFRLKKVGEDKAGVIYTIKVEGQDKYMMTKNSEAGTDVTISKPGANVAPTKWILHKHGELYQIIHKENGANAITFNNAGLELARNQGGKGFSFDIKVK